MQRILLSVLSARMLLHLRQDAAGQQNALQTITDLQFADVGVSSDTSATHDDGWFGQRNANSSHPSQ